MTTRFMLGLATFALYGARLAVGADNAVEFETPAMPAMPANPPATW